MNRVFRWHFSYTCAALSQGTEGIVFAAMAADAGGHGPVLAGAALPNSRGTTSEDWDGLVLSHILREADVDEPKSVDAALQGAGVSEPDLRASLVKLLPNRDLSDVTMKPLRLELAAELGVR